MARLFWPFSAASFQFVQVTAESDPHVRPPEEMGKSAPFANLIDIDFPVVPASGKRTHARHGGNANVGIAVLLQKMPKRRDITAYRVEKRTIAHHRVC